MLEKQQLRVPVRYAPFYDHLSDSQLRADLLAQQGRTHEALQAYDALDIHRGADPVYLAAAHLAKARLLDKAGDREGAIQQYASFIDLWKSCEAAERGEVEKSQVRVGQLRVADQRASR
jgi:tetratricopeptide (TPR) repeat protein